MRHPARLLALAACLALAGTAADASPGRRHRAAPAAPAVDDADEIEMEPTPARAPRPRKAARSERAHDTTRALAAPFGGTRKAARIKRDADVDADADEQPRASKRKTARIDRDAEAADDEPRARKRKAARIDRDAEAADDADADADEPRARKRRAARIDRDAEADADEADDDADEPRARKRKAARIDADADDADADGDEPRASKRDADDGDRVALREESDDDEADDEDRAPIAVRAHTLGRAPSDWHVAVGPYVWASSVDAEVSLGSASVGSGVDFMDLKRHTRYGAELLAEVSYRGFKLSTDMMYGVIDLDGEKTVGPLMVSLAGTASSLLLDSNLSYRLIGGDSSAVAVEGLAGLRYQRTNIEGAVGLAGSEVASMEKVSEVADAIAGARVYLRPTRRLAASGAVDLGVFGDSSLTWSASADASVRITSHLQLSLGYRALTMNGASVSMRMHGPRAALQLMF